MILLLYVLINQVFAQSDDLRICTQNLKLFTINREDESQLFKRLKFADCDILAVQEVVGVTVDEASNTLEYLARNIQINENKYLTLISQSSSGSLYLGFIYKHDRLKLISFDTHKKIKIQKLSIREPQQIFSRRPLTVILEDKLSRQTISLTNIHLKSKSSREKFDPTGLSYEPERMLQAAAINNLNQNSDINIILGDRNSTPDSASAALLKGKVNLVDFQDSNCKVLDAGGLECLSYRNPKYQSTLGTLCKNSNFGTFNFKSKYYCLDDILINSSLELTWKAFLIDRFAKASDHSLVLLRLWL